MKVYFNKIFKKWIFWCVEQCDHHNERGTIATEEDTRGTEGKTTGCCQSEKTEDVATGRGKKKAGPFERDPKRGKSCQGFTIKQGNIFFA